MDLVSVVIPAFNAAATLDRTLDSVRAQDWTALEIVVVDDGSTDDTADIVRRHAAADPRVRLVQQENKGVTFARNTGIRETRGAFVAPVDSDDVWHPTKITLQMRRMAEIGPSCGMVYNLSRWIDEEDRVFADTGVPGFDGRAHLRTMVVNPVLNGSALLMRRAAIEEAGAYPEELDLMGLPGCEDFYLQSAVAQRWVIGSVDLWLTGYRKSRTGLSRNRLRMKRSRVAAVRLLRQRYPETATEAAKAAEAVALGGCAFIALRMGRLGEAATKFGQALALSPLAAIDTVARQETPLFFRSFLRKATPLWRAPRPGPKFLGLDASKPFETRRAPPLGWLLSRLAAEEMQLHAKSAPPPTAPA